MEQPELNETGDPDLDGEEDCITPPAISLDCPECKQEYNDHINRPKLLSCDHTVCKACLTKLSPEFECRLCRQQISINEGGVLTDLTVLHALKMPGINLFGQDDDKLPRDVPVDAKEDVGKQTNIETSNLVVNCSSPVEFEIDGTKSKHSHEASMESNSPGCSPQGSMTTAERSACQFEVSSQSNADMVNELLKAQFQLAMDETKSKLALLETRSCHLDASKENTTVQIDKEFDHLIHMINRRRKLLKGQAEDIYTELKEQLAEDSERLTLNMMCLKSLSSHAKIMMKGKGDRLQSTYHQISSEISELHENVDQVSLDGVISIEFDTKDKMKDFERNIRLLGKVQTGVSNLVIKKPEETKCDKGHADEDEL